MLSLALAGSIGAVVASAATIDQDSEPATGQTTVTYSVSDSWEVTIPETIVVNGAGGNVTVSKVVIEQGKQLAVTVESTNDWKVQDAEGNGFTYELKSGEDVISSGVLTVAAGTETETTKTLTAELNDSNGGKYSTGGETYEETLTFTVTIADAD